MHQCVGALFRAGAVTIEGANGCKRGRWMDVVMEVFLSRCLLRDEEQSRDEKQSTPPSVMDV